MSIAACPYFQRRMAHCHPFLLGIFLVLGLLLSEPTLARSEFNATVKAAYADALKLKLESSRQLSAKALAQNPRNLCALLVSNYPDALYLLFTEDQSQFDRLIARQENRLLQIRKSKEKSPYLLYSQAEIYLQLGFCKLKFGKEIQAAFDLRKAYTILEQNHKIYPNFEPNLKSLGLLHVLIGSVPEKYQWLLSTFGFRGTTQQGRQELKQAATSLHPFRVEAALTKALVLEYLYKERTEQNNFFEQLALLYPDNLLFRFMYATVLKKEKRGDEAIAQLLARPQAPEYVNLPYVHHMLADLYLYKTDYEKAITHYHLFLDQYRGRNNIKHTYHQMHLAALLSGDKTSAEAYRQKVLSEGELYLEEDRYAHTAASQTNPQNPILLKARLLSDGGYYQAALQAIATFDINRTRNQKQVLEFYYRKARIYHSLNETALAKTNYQRTVDLAGDLPYYFAPNACLQLGYLYQDEGQNALARKYFSRALAYPKHEYKNSIDSKAKIALAELG